MNIVVRHASSLRFSPSERSPLNTGFPHPLCHVNSKLMNPRPDLYVLCQVAVQQHLANCLQLTCHLLRRSSKTEYFNGDSRGGKGKYILCPSTNWSNSVSRQNRPFAYTLLSVRFSHSNEQLIPFNRTSVLNASSQWETWLVWGVISHPRWHFVVVIVILTRTVSQLKPPSIFISFYLPRVYLIICWAFTDSPYIALTGTCSICIGAYSRAGSGLVNQSGGGNSWWIEDQTKIELCEFTQSLRLRQIGA